MPSATGSLFHFHQTHAARGLERQAFVITKRWNLDAGLARGFDDQRALFGLDGAAIDRELDEF
jgi:hypothetical protein